MIRTKQYYERSLNTAYFSRKYLILPCLILSGVALMYNALIDQGIGFYLFMFIFNIFSLWTNHKLVDMYISTIEDFIAQEQRARVKDLNPHGR